MIERREGDEMLRLSLMDGQARVMLCETTAMCQRAADIHGATPVCTAAMGRLMTATAFLGVMMKGENESVTVTVKGGGPMGVGKSNAKVYVQRETGITFKDVVMFPYRLIKGLFGFLNFFTTIFGGESLKTGGASANGAKAKQRSQKDMIIEGNVINAEKLDKINEANGDKTAGIMPASRVLIRRTADGSEDIIKKGVLDYALEGSGSVIVSNGRHLLRIDRDGNESHIAKAKIAVNLNIVK